MMCKRNNCAAHYATTLGFVSKILPDRCHRLVGHRDMSFGLSNFCTSWRYLLWLPNGCRHIFMSASLLVGLVQLGRPPIAFKAATHIKSISKWKIT